MPSPAENAVPTSDRRHTHTRGGSEGDGSSTLRDLTIAPDTRHPDTRKLAPFAVRDRAEVQSLEGVGISATPQGPSTDATPDEALPAATSTHSQGGQPPGRGAKGGGRRLPARTRRILHLDVDAFLASVEQALHPELAGQAVVVGGMPTDRNLVMSCSYPARAFGVKPGMRLSEAYRLCPRAIFRRGDAQAAKRLREGVARILMRATPCVEVASIDDFFADLTGTARVLGAAFDVAVGMRAAIRDELRLPVTIGIGTNRTLARLAGKLAKPGGVAEIWPGHETAFLSALPLEHLPGAGHVVGRMLERFGLRTAGEIALVPREILFASFGSIGLVVHDRARGIDTDPVEATFEARPDGTWTERTPRSIRRDSTFEPEEGRRDLVEAMLCYLVERAAHKLRSHRAVARSIAVRVQYVDTRPHPSDRPRESPASAERRQKLDPPSDSTDAITRHVLAIWSTLPRRRALVKRVGITFVDLAPRGGWQGHLFDDDGPRAAAADGSAARASRADRQRRLDQALDHVRERHGFGRILRGSSFVLGATHELERDGYRLRTPSLNQ